MDGGDPIPTTTHSNTTYRTKSPRSLVEITDGAFTAAYDPDSVSTVLAAINDNGLMTLTFPDDTTMTFYGYIKSFKPNAFVEGEPATAECEIVVTNDNAGVETGPA